MITIPGGAEDCFMLKSVVLNQLTCACPKLCVWKVFRRFLRLNLSSPERVTLFDSLLRFGTSPKIAQNLVTGAQKRKNCEDQMCGLPINLFGSSFDDSHFQRLISMLIP